MTKKDYELIARVIKKEAEKWKAESKYAFAISAIAYNLAEELGKENTRFRKDLFINACMPD